MNQTEHKAFEPCKGASTGPVHKGNAGVGPDISGELGNSEGVGDAGALEQKSFDPDRPASTHGAAVK